MSVEKDLLKGSGLRVAVERRGIATAHCRWVLMSMGVEVVDGDSAGPQGVLGVVLDGQANSSRVEADVTVVRAWDFQVGRPGNGVLASAASGVSWVLGIPGETPLALPLGIPEKWAGTLAASLVLADHLSNRIRDASSAPARYDVSAADILHSFARQNFGNHYETPGGWRRNGRTTPGHGGIFPQGFFPCADGFVAAVARSRRDWEQILAALGDPEWATGDLRDPVSVARDPEHAQEEFERSLQSFDRDELLHLATQTGATLAPVYSRAEGLARRLGDSSVDEQAGLPFEITYAAREAR